jgi:hypothetical protein
MVRQFEEDEEESEHSAAIRIRDSGLQQKFRNGITARTSRGNAVSTNNSRSADGERRGVGSSELPETELTIEPRFRFPALLRE